MRSSRMAKHLRSRASIGEHVTPFNEAGGQRQTPGGRSFAPRARAWMPRGEGRRCARATVAEVALYFDTLKTIALRGYERNGSAECAVLEFAREASEAQSRRDAARRGALAVRSHGRPQGSARAHSRRRTRGRGSTDSSRPTRSRSAPFASRNDDGPVAQFGAERTHGPGSR
jgi:hypothetical protein